MSSFLTSSSTRMLLVLTLFAVHGCLAQDGKQASAGPLSDFLNTVRAPKIGYAPGVQQAVSNTGAQPNIGNLLPGLGGANSGIDPNGSGQILQAPLQAFGRLAQAGQSAFTGFAQMGGQLLNTAFQPLQQFALALFTPATFRNGTTLVPGFEAMGLLSRLGDRIGNQTGVPTAGQPFTSNLIPKAKAA